MKEPSVDAIVLWAWSSIICEPKTIQSCGRREGSSTPLNLGRFRKHNATSNHSVTCLSRASLHKLTLLSILLIDTTTSGILLVPVPPRPMMVHHVTIWHGVAHSKSAQRGSVTDPAPGKWPRNDSVSQATEEWFGFTSDRGMIRFHKRPRNDSVSQATEEWFGFTSDRGMIRFHKRPRNDSVSQATEEWFGFTAQENSTIKHPAHRYGLIWPQHCDQHGRTFDQHSSSCN